MKRKSRIKINKLLLGAVLLITATTLAACGKTVVNENDHSVKGNAASLVSKLNMYKPRFKVAIHTRHLLSTAKSFKN